MSRDGACHDGHGGASPVARFESQPKPCRLEKLLRKSSQQNQNAFQGRRRIMEVWVHVSVRMMQVVVMSFMVMLEVHPVLLLSLVLLLQRNNERCFVT